MVQTLITNYFHQSNKKSYKIFKNNNKIYQNNDIKENTIIKNTIIRGYNLETDSWHCIECGIDMGPCNPRQLCKKTYCGNN